MARPALRQARQARGEAQDTTAHALGVTPVTLGRWERGTTDIRLANRRLIAEYFGVALSEVTSWVDSPCPRCATDAAGDGPATEARGGVSVEAPTMDDRISVEARTPDGRTFRVSLSRREFGELLAAGGLGALVPVGLASPHDRERVALAAREPRRTDRTIIEYLRRVLDEHRDADELAGPRHLRDVVSAQLRHIEQSLDAARPEVRGELLEVGAQYAVFLSWLHLDAGDEKASVRAVDRSLEWARASGDDCMVSYVLISKGNRACAKGDAAGGAQLAKEAQRRPWRLTPGVVSVARIQEASAHAQEGDEAACRRSVEDATDALRDWRAHAEPAYNREWSTAQLASIEATCYRELGHYERAAATFERGITELPTMYYRDRGQYRARQAVAYAEGNDPERAAQAGTQALFIATETGSERTRAELKRLDAALAPWATVPAVTEFRQVLRGAA